MNFVIRAATGLLLTAVTLALIAGGMWRVMDSRSDSDSRRSRDKTVRAPLVNVLTLDPIETQPTLTAYGEVKSWRRLELRATQAGRLVDVADNFRDGAEVREGSVLFVIDPADPQAKQEDAQTSLAEAEAEMAEAREAVLAAEQELSAAQRQLVLRRQSLERQRSLKKKGFATDADLESAELAYASADQSVLNRSQMVISARKRIERADLKAERARISLSQAARDVGDTNVTAPFRGLLTGVNAVLGRLVGVNEKLGELVDPASLEVAFRVSNRQFSRLLDDRGQLIKRPMRATLELGDRRIAAPGVVDRVDAVVGEGQSGRRLVARLDVEADTVFRPGDFVTVTVREASLANVADIPATAATEDGKLLVLDENGVLAEVSAVIERRQDNRLLVSGVPFGVRVVAERLPQLGAGVAVRAAEPRAPSEGGSVAAAPPSDTVELDPERREILVTAVSQAKRIPDEMRERLLTLLAKPRVPRRLVERIETRIKERQAAGS